MSRPRPRAGGAPRRPRVLLASADPAVSAALAGVRGVEASRADDLGSALAACAGPRPPAAVVADADLPGGGVELLARVRAEVASAARLLVVGGADLELVGRAVAEAEVHRLLPKPLDAARLRAELRAALRRNEERAREQVLVEQLLFAREHLASLTGSLERRLEQEMRGIRALQELADGLGASRDLEEIASRAAAAATDVLGRPARVELTDPSRPATNGAAASPAFPAGRRHVASVRTTEGELGSIAVELGERAAVDLTPRDRRLLASIVTSTALAARGQIRRSERDRAQLATVFAMARLAERRDNETGRHLERVSAYCRLVATGLRADGHHTDVLDDRYVEDLVLAAPLHDIGKVGIPDRILLKPGRLTAEEWETMRRHTDIGAETLRALLEQGEQPSFLRMGHDIAWSHHERWDGSGYPRGLSGDSIPLAARIVSLADVYDALTSERPYKRAWPHARAMELVVSERGKQFDPAVVDAFVRRETEVHSIRRRLRDEPEPSASAA